MICAGSGAAGCGLRFWMRTGSGAGAGLITGAGTGATGLTTGAGFAGAVGGVFFLFRGDSFGATVGLITGAGAGVGTAGAAGFTTVGGTAGSGFRMRFLERPVSGLGVVGMVG